MNQDSLNKKFLEIPGDNIFIHTFKFNLNPPLVPIPYSKMLYYPLESDRYLKPKMLGFFYNKMNTILTKCDMNMPVDLINMQANKLNPKENQQIPLDKEDEELVNETLNKQQAESSSESEDEKPKVDAMRYMGNLMDKDLKIKQQQLLQQRNKTEEFNYEIKLKEIIENQFAESAQINMKIQHPSNSALKCKKVYDILPNFDTLSSDMIYFNESDVPVNIKNQKYVLKFDLDEEDRQEIFKLFEFDPQFKKVEEVPPIPTDQKMENEEESQQIRNDEEQKNSQKQENESEIITEKKELTQIQQEASKLTQIKQQEQKLLDFQAQNKYYFKHRANFGFSKVETNKNLRKNDIFLNLFDKTHKSCIQINKGNFILRKKRIPQSTAHYELESYQVKDSTKTKTKKVQIEKYIKIIVKHPTKYEIITKKRKFEKFNYRKGVMEQDQKIQDYVEQPFIDSDQENQAVDEEQELLEVQDDEQNSENSYQSGDEYSARARSQSSNENYFNPQDERQHEHDQQELKELEKIVEHLEQSQKKQGKNNNSKLNNSQNQYSKVEAAEKQPEGEEEYNPDHLNQQQTTQQEGQAGDDNNNKADDNEDNNNNNKDDDHFFDEEEEDSFDQDNEEDD